MEEIWKDIPNYEGYYQVSNLGNVKSLARIIMHRGKYPFISKQRLLKLTLLKHGYYSVNLTKNSIQTTYTIHGLVAMSFLGHKPNGMSIVIDHINNNKTDNRLCNLQLINQRDNCSKDKHRYNYTSKYVGVGYDKSNNKYNARIVLNGKQKHLGLFKNEIDAHHAYQNALNNLVV